MAVSHLPKVPPPAPGGRPAGRGGPNPNWPKNYSLVPYGETDASRLAIEMRIERNLFLQTLGYPQNTYAFSGMNVAVVTYRDEHDPSKLHMIPMVSTGGTVGVGGLPMPGGPHSEERLLATLQNAGIPLDRVVEVYTERQPCGEDHHNCAHTLAQALPKDAKVTFSVEYGDAASQERGNEMLRSNWREQAARLREHDLSQGGGAVGIPAPGLSPEAHGGGNAMIDALRRQVAGDAAALGILDGMQRGETQASMKERLNLTDTQFDKARERLRDAAL